MKINQLKLGSFLSYLQMAIGVIIGLLYTPIMIQLLGKNEYGLYNTVSSTISMLSVLSLGINSSYIHYFSIYKKENNTVSIYKLNGLFLIILSIIGCVALACGLFLSFHLDVIFKYGLTTAEYELARVLMLLLTVNLSISFPMSVFANIIAANERFVYLKLLNLIKTVVSPLLTLPLLLMGYRSIAMVSITVALALITDILYLYYVLFILKNKFIFHSFEKGIFVSLLIYTSFIAINLIVDQINWNIDKILLGRFKGTSAVAVYSVGYSLNTYYMMFSTSISGVFTPRVHKIVNQTYGDFAEQRLQLTSLFTKVGRIQFLFLGLIASGLIFFGKDFIVRYWAGADYADSYYVMLLLILPASIPLIQNLGIEIQRAENRHSFRSVVYGAMALLNLGLSYYLCQVYGAIGSALGTAVSLVLANGLVMNIYYYKKCNIDIVLFWKNILRMSVGLIVPIGFGVVMTIFIKTQSTVLFLLKMSLYSLVYCVFMWFLSMNDYEKTIVKLPLHTIGRKFRKV